MQDENGSTRSARVAPAADVVDLIHDLDAIIWEMDPATWRFTFVSRHAEDLLGYPIERWLDEPHFWADTLVHPDDRERAIELCRKATEEGCDHRLEYRAVASDGRVLWLRDLIRVAVDARGGRQLRGIMFDVSERERSEAELRRQRAYFARLFENAPEAIVLLDEEDRVLRVNKEFSRIFGYAPAEATGRPLNDLVVPEGRGEEASELSRHALRGRRVGRETVRRRKDGTLVPVSILAVPVEVEEGTVQVYGIYRDLSSQRETEEALEKSETHLRSLLDGVRAIVWECDARTWEFNYISPGVEEILGYPVEEWYGDSELWARTIHPDDRRRVLEACRAGMEACVDSTLEYRAVARGGGVVWLRDIIHVVTDGKGRPERLRGVMIDITDEKVLEEQLLQAQKMDAVGRLAGGIAHDFNNVLTVIQGHTQLLLEELRESHPLRGDVEEIERSAGRAAALTRQLLAFGRRQLIRPEVLDLNRLVDRMEVMLGRLIGEDVVLGTDLAPEPVWILAGPGQIEQVIVNLVVNARDALVRGGEIRIETRAVEIGEGEAARMPGSLRPGPYVLLTVSDTGIGMSTEVRERIFDPFFTTKEVGRGTGLGLSTVYGTVKQSGGHVRCHSEPGAGTTFEIHLPRVEAPHRVGVGAGEGGTDDPVSGSGTILVAEDEARVRSLVGRILRRSGYQVLEAANGVEALRVAEGHDGPIDLVVSDVVMPEMGGRELAERLRHERPEVPFLFMSGYTEDELVRRGVADGRTLMIEKPFSPGLLTRRILEVLEERA